MSIIQPIHFKNLQDVDKFFSQDDSKYYYISYSEFFDTFQIDLSYPNKINKQIADIHIRFRNAIFSEMSIYKWTPIIIYSGFRLAKLRRPNLIFPIVFTYLFDYYFEDFFIWRNKDKNIINIKNVFQYDVIRKDNIIRKLRLANKYAEIINKNERKQIPIKYIKFGEWTPYIYNINQTDLRQSYIYLTKKFEWYMYLKSIRQKNLTDDFKLLITSLYNQYFKEYKGITQKKYHMYQSIIFRNVEGLLNNKFMNYRKIPSILNQVQYQIRQIIQFIVYNQTSIFTKSYFRIQNFKIKQEVQSQKILYKYNIFNNKTDLILYYSMIAIPTIILKIFKR